MLCRSKAGLEPEPEFLGVRQRQVALAIVGKFQPYCVILGQGFDILDVDFTAQIADTRRGIFGIEFVINSGQRATQYLAAQVQVYVFNALGRCPQEQVGPAIERMQGSQGVENP